MSMILQETALVCVSGDGIPVFMAGLPGKPPCTIRDQPRDPGSRDVMNTSLKTIMSKIFKAVFVLVWVVVAALMYVLWILESLI